MTAPSNNSIFVVGFAETVTKEDVQAFFEKNLPAGSAIAKIAMLKGRSRRIPGQEERQAGVPYSFVTFENESSVQAALALLNAPSKLTGDFANIKIEQVGNKERVTNSVYVSGFKYSDSVQGELKKLFDSNLKVNAEVDVRKAIVKNKETSEEEDKSFAFVFLPTAEAKAAALSTLRGAKVGGSSIEVVERAEPKPRQPRRRPAAASDKDGAAASSSGRGRGGRGRGRGGRGRGRGRGGRGRGGRGGSRSTKSE